MESGIDSVLPYRSSASHWITGSVFLFVFVWKQDKYDESE